MAENVRPASAPGAELADELAVEVPVGGADEAHPLPLALDHQPGAHALHPPHRAARPDLLAGHVGQRAVAVDAIEQATGLLGVHQPPVDVAGMLDGLADGLGRDLVEHHPLHRDRGRRVEHLEQVPGDGFALAILIRGQIELGGPLDQRLEPPDHVLLLGRHDVEGLEVVVDVDPQDLPLPLERLRDVGRPRGQITDVTDRGLDVDGAVEAVRVRQEALDGPSLGRGLDDD